jgi:hypothetical protein
MPETHPPLMAGMIEISMPSVGGLVRSPVERDSVCPTNT